MERIAIAAAAAIFGLMSQPVTACENDRQAVQATPITTVALQIAPAAVQQTPELPALASLTVDSNFTVFMQPDVPSSVRTSALRKLWRLNPAFNRPDGLDSDFLDHRY